MRRVADSEDPPETGSEVDQSPTHIHEFDKVLGATPTTFKHNDRTSHKP
jgi:hypothetical protein